MCRPSGRWSGASRLVANQRYQARSRFSAPGSMASVGVSVCCGCCGTFPHRPPVGHRVVEAGVTDLEVGVEFGLALLDVARRVVSPLRALSFAFLELGEPVSPFLFGIDLPGAEHAYRLRDVA